MKPENNDKKFDELLTGAISREKTRFDFDKWKNAHQDEIENFKSQTTDGKALQSAHPPNIWRTIMKSKITKLAAAAVIIIAALIAARLLTGSFDGAAKAYAVTDIPELYRNVKNLHLKGWTATPRPGVNVTDVNSIKQPIEAWIDLAGGRMRHVHQGVDYIGDQVKSTQLETIVAGSYSMSIDHTNKTVSYTKLSDFFRHFICQLNIDSLMMRFLGQIKEVSQFQNAGNERINGIDYEIWKGDYFPSFPPGIKANLKLWLDPLTGNLGRTNARITDKDGKLMTASMIELERDIRLTDEIFSLKPPENYTSLNTLETANNAGPMSIGNFGYGNLSLGLHISFTLSGGSVVLCWSSQDRDAQQNQADIFSKLRFGGELPQLSVTVTSLQPVILTGKSAPEYIGYHLAYTVRDGQFYEWSIYIPDSAIDEIDPITYKIVPKMQDERLTKEWKIEAMANEGILIDNGLKFEQLLLGAMKEMSDEGAVIDKISYEDVLALTEQIKASGRK